MPFNFVFGFIQTTLCHSNVFAPRLYEFEKCENKACCFRLARRFAGYLEEYVSTIAASLLPGEREEQRVNSRKKVKGEGGKGCGDGEEE